MIIPLANIADVSPGITLRGPDAAKPTADGNYHLLRISDLREDGRLHFEESSMICLEPVFGKKHALTAGDIVIAAKGSRATAGIFVSTRPTVAGAQFYVIRPRISEICPEYLAWYLNLPETQNRLMDTAKGTFVRAIPANALRYFPVDIPPLKIQHQIAALHALHLKEQHLMTLIAERRAQLIKAKIAALAKGK